MSESIVSALTGLGNTKASGSRPRVIVEIKLAPPHAANLAGARRDYSTVLANGIALSKIHHAGFDSHLIGIDPHGRVHIDRAYEARRRSLQLIAARGCSKGSCAPAGYATR